MELKTIIILLIIILNILAAQAETAAARGIIIADDHEILEIFKAHDQTKVLELARAVSNYDQVILHLGAQKVFSRGHPFFYRTSRANLISFSEELQKQEQELYLWFMDSFGSEMFLDLYTNYQQIIDANYSVLQELDLEYAGIVIDLEWINLGLENDSADNSDKYLEILKYLNNKFKNKEIYAFMSIVDNQEENSNRGYKEKEILQYLDNIIPMLYLKDAGFYFSDSELEMVFTEDRIEVLRDYYQNKDYRPAVSLEGGIFLEENDNLYFIKTTNNFDFQAQTELIYRNESKYHIISGYKLLKSFKVERNDGQSVEIAEDQRLHFLEIKADNILMEADYIWEYFQLQQ